MKKCFQMLFAAVLVLWSVVPSHAGSTQVDALIRKLVDKGILSKSEAMELKTEIAADEKIMREEGLKTSLPEWVQKMKLKGDMRTRYQYERANNDTEARARGRMRFRLGVETEVNKTVKVGAGLATGGADPRSTNQTFQDSFQTPDIRLDYAYGEWKPVENFKAIVGKFGPKDYLWTPADLLWDTDITVDGSAVHVEHKLSEATKLWANGSVLMLDENGKTDKGDPWMGYTQGGVTHKQGMMDVQLASTYYGFKNLSGSCPNWTAGTNTGVTAGSDGACTGGLPYRYDSIGASAEVGFKKPLGGLPFKIDDRIAFFGDFIHNFEKDIKDAEHSGWAFGARLGHEKINGRGQWQLKYIKGVLEKDAWPDFLPDSDRLAGKTNMKSHEIEFVMGLSPNITFGIDYYKSDSLVGSENQEQLIQGDLVFKF